MTLNAAIEAELPFLRDEALARMTSSATVRRNTGETLWDGRVESPVWEVTHTHTPFRLGGAPRGASQSRTVDVAGVEVEVPVRVGHFPHGTTDLADGDLIEVTAGECAGLVFRIVEADLADQQTAVRVPVVGVKRPTEWGDPA